MSIIVTVQEAQSRLSELLVRVERGEDVVIVWSGRPIAHLAPVNPVPPRTFGILDLAVPDSFFDPLDETELAAWE